MTRQSGKVRLADIAAEVGVSVMSVASVVNHAGKNSVKVSDATASRILEACKRLNYQPNMNARALRGTPLKLIGVLVDSQSWQSTRFLISELEREAVEHGYLLLVGQAHNNIEHLAKVYQFLLQHGVSGVICLSHDYPGGHDELVKYFGQATKMVFLANPELPGQPFVELNRAPAVYNAVHAMRRSGADRIGLFIANDDLRYSHQVMEGYRKGLAGADEFVFKYEHDLAPDTMLEAAARAVEEFIGPNRLNGLFGMNDYYTAALLQRLTQCGMKVPDDIQLCGYDNELFCNFTVPPLSSVSGNVRQRAQALFLTLLEVLDGREPEIRVVEPEFIHRGSIKIIK